ncbi:MAG: non-canonical purine NTP pyrophosphatase [Candidatus Levybacteria bacterium]|nr:non-canonical purine NTP pyrophosphatase [Candidatus Levybacteria bacterium]
MVGSITFITGNQAKVEWLRRHITTPVDHQKLDIPEIQSLELKEVVKYKAEEAFRQLQLPLLVEDTSLRFTALGRLPGPLIKWFLDELGTEGLCKLLDSYDDRTAVAEVVYGLHTGQEVVLFGATVHGRIANSPRGANGFGWDNAFIPEGSEKTWGEMNQEEQNNTSLRETAIIKLNAFLDR